ncbi:hypothetical protein [Burkholderia gladioli]|uniref:Uncharacterized protein n=1 Tax=Burkholderia gladioli TaxID=28095 RepID=A0AB38U600_BURGA|nr:hypothetical protein [Burkholderia gladioli]AYQ85984.1 hypothetical protein EDD84_00110 [Burkholderia gladioli]UWX75432.1 hypothetical protein NYZ96_36035 [Burkholderia gladioli]
MAVSTKARVSAQRAARLQAGWTEVRVWAASRDDVNAIRQFSEELKMKTLEKKVREIGRARNTPPAVVDRALAALHLQESSEFNTPSGATLTLLSDLAGAQQVRDMNAVVEMFALAYPGNAQFVKASIPAKVIHRSVAYRLDFRCSERIRAWEEKHPDWPSDVAKALDNFTLDAWTDAAVREMQAINLD